MILRTRHVILKNLYQSKQFICTNSSEPACQFRQFHKHRLRYHRKMPPSAEAHIRCFEKDGKFNLIFSIDDLNSGKSRRINFERNLQEPLESLLRRITTKMNSGNVKKKKKKRSDEPNENTSADVMPAHVMRNGLPVSGETMCSDLFQNPDSRDLILKIGDLEYQICINRPWIERMNLPRVLLAGYPAYPYKFELFFADQDDCEYLWYKHSTCDLGELGDRVHSGYIYTPATQDIGSYLKLVCTPKRGDMVGEALETISDSVVEAGPGQCFSDVRHSFTRKSLIGNSFRVVSYNILADLYVSSSAGKNELFTYCPEYARSIHYRKLLLLKELTGYNADLICLQEVDSPLFERDLTKILKTVGLEGVFTKKGGEVNEGVACFYNKSRFKLVENYSSLLSGEEARERPYWKSIWEKILLKEELYTFLNNLHTTVQVLVFEYLERTDHKIIVANTHLYFRPDADVIRILQAGLCLNLVDHVRTMIQEREPDSTISVIFCGDFNSTPECGVFQLFTKNHVPEDYHEWKSAPADFQLEGMSLRNNINFDSACGSPEFTNFTVGFEGCLDYIYYNTDLLLVEEVLPFPSREEVSEHVAIPSIAFPSDHIALVADLKWKR